MNTTLHKLLTNGLTVRDAIVMERANQSAPVNHKLLCCEHISPANCTRILKKLEARGYISRESSEEDRRWCLFATTSKGKEILRG